MSDEIRAKGKQIRRELQGDRYVSEQRGRVDPAWQAFQDQVDLVYGSIWSRPGLGRRERCLVTVAALAALDRKDELERHLIAAQRNGVTIEALKEVALQLSMYAGFPATVGMWRLLERLEAQPPAQ